MPQETPSDPSAAAVTAAPKRRRRWKRWLLGIVLVLLIAAELVARFKFGLGDPPLMMTDPQIEYLYKPSRTYHRFGNTISYNSFSMRSDEFPARKPSSDELRILVLGDSIINGGAWTDQSQIATSLLQSRLRAKLHRPITVGNISAASWGPPNLLAYMNRFGWFDADIVIIVVGSEDYGDNPHFGPLAWDAPEHTPICALQEVAFRYVPQLVGWALKGASRSAPEATPAPSQEDIDASIFALGQLIDKARASGALVVVAMHQERMECATSPKAGYLVLRMAAKKRDVPVLEFKPAFQEALNAGNEPFRDWVHPNAFGQSLMCDVLEDWVLQQQAAGIHPSP